MRESLHFHVRQGRHFRALGWEEDPRVPPAPAPTEEPTVEEPVEPTEEPVEPMA